MLFGSRENNIKFIAVVIFVSMSCLTSVVGQILWNTRTIKEAVQRQEEMMVQHNEILEILRRIERRSLEK